MVKLVIMGILILSISILGGILSGIIIVKTVDYFIEKNFSKYKKERIENDKCR